MDNSFVSIADLFGNRQIIPAKRSSERGELIGFIAEAIQRPARYAGIRCAHLTLDQLYVIKSGYADRLHRNDSLTAVKYLWFITKTELSTGTES